jgi:hypothetical protein
VNWKGFGRNGSRPNLRSYPSIRLEILRKTMKNLNEDSLSPGPRFEPGTSRIRSRSVNAQAERTGHKLRTRTIQEDVVRQRRIETYPDFETKQII